MTVQGEDFDAACEDAQRRYDRVHRRAGLDPPVTRVVGWVTHGYPREKLWEAIQDDSHSLMASGRFDLAVVRAYTAVEIHLRSALAELLSVRLGDKARDRILTRGTLSPLEQGLRLLGALADAEPLAHESWTEFKESRASRNAILHEGHKVAGDDAAATLKAARSFHEYVESVRFSATIKWRR